MATNIFDFNFSSHYAKRLHVPLLIYQVTICSQYIIVYGNQLTSQRKVYDSEYL